MAAPARAQSGPAASPFKYAVFGVERVVLEAHVRIEAGDVGANLGTVRLGPGTRVAGSAAAYSVRVAPGVVARRLFCLFLDGPSKSFCRDVTIPLVTEALPLVQVLPGASEVRVPARGFTAPLEPGAYGTVQVAAHGNLLFKGGRYDVRAMRLGPHARVLCQTECDLAVGGRIRLGADAAVRAAETAHPATLHVEVVGGSHGPAFRAGPGSAFSGVVYAPTSDVILGAGGRYQGSFIGRRVLVRPGAHVRFGT